jgi:Ca2+-binding EF-hand superfamily protein
MAPDQRGDWGAGPSSSQSANDAAALRRESEERQRYSDAGGESKNSSGAQLPASDPFVLASFHAGTHLEELQKQDNTRKRVAQVREEVIMQRARRLRAKTEYNRDITRLQHKEVGKAIMAQQVAVGVEAKLRQGDVMDERKKRELRRVTNPFKHNPSDKWIKGPFLGEGPLPARVMDAPRRQARRDRERSTFVYDPHGRRVLRKSMGAMRSGPPVEAAMTKLREAAMTSSAYFMDLRDLFDRFDTEQNGFLSRKEMLAAVHSMGVKLTEAEAAALADHFDANGNGTVAFSEFSFGFFNRRSLICKWRMAKGPGMRSDASIMMIFRKYDADASGRLEAGEFARCLSDMGIRLSELELQILAEQFDENRDGYIQPKEFLRFMKKLVAEDAGMKKKNREKYASSVLENVRRTANAAEPGGARANARAKALKKKVRAQEEEIKRLEQFVQARLARSSRK